MLLLCLRGVQPTTSGHRHGRYKARTTLDLSLLDFWLAGILGYMYSIEHRCGKPSISDAYKSHEAAVLISRVLDGDCSHTWVCVSMAHATCVQPKVSENIKLL